MKQPTLTRSQRESLERYRGLVLRYHAALDLMSSAALDDWDAHVEGALDFASELNPGVTPSSGEILDLGSGAGLPAIVLAIALPQRRIHLVERRRRRATFLELALAQLDLINATVHAVDVRQLKRTDVSPTGVAFITAQAVAPFDQVYALTCPLHAGEVRFVSRKGAHWKAEIDTLERQIGVRPAVRSRSTKPRGTLVAFGVPGGLVCPSSE